MGKTAAFKAEFLKDGHLSIPKRVIRDLSLKKGAKVHAIIESEKFDRQGFLSLFGIWKDKDNKEISIN